MQNDVGLICCAVGGARLDQWQPGESDCSGKLYRTYQTRFETMMQTFQNALNLHDVSIVF